MLRDRAAEIERRVAGAGVGEPHAAVTAAAADLRALEELLAARDLRRIRRRRYRQRDAVVDVRRDRVEQVGLIVGVERAALLDVDRVPVVLDRVAGGGAKQKAGAEL